MPTTAFKIGSLAQDSPTGIKILVAHNVAGAHYMTFETPVGTDYQVPAGKTFYITKISYSVAAATASATIGSGTAAVGEGAVAPAGYVALTGLYYGYLAFTQYEGDAFIPIAQNLYPCLVSGGGAVDANIFGIEV